MGWLLFWRRRRVPVGVGVVIGTRTLFGEPMTRALAGMVTTRRMEGEPAGPRLGGMTTVRRLFGEYATLRLGGAKG